MLIFFTKGKEGSKVNRQLNYPERDFICILGDKGYDEYQIQDFVSMLFNFKLTKSQINATLKFGLKKFKDQGMSEEEKKKAHGANVDLLNDIEGKYLRERKDEISKVGLLKNETFLNLKKRVENDKMTDMTLLKIYQSLFDHHRLLANQPTSIHKYEKFTDEDLAKRLKELERGETLYLGRIEKTADRGEVEILATAPKADKLLSFPGEETPGSGRE